MNLEEKVARLNMRITTVERELKQAIEVLKHVSSMLLLLDLEGVEYDSHRVPEQPGGMNYFG